MTLINQRIHSEFCNCAVEHPSLSQVIQVPMSMLGSSGAVTVLVVVIILLILLLILVFICRKRIKPAFQTKAKPPIEVMEIIAPSKKQQGSMDFFSGSVQEMSHFDSQTLKKATMNFHPDNFLGSGGYGPVYRGKLSDGRLIAVKTLNLNKAQQGEKQFLSEVRLITSIQHKNLVRLLGCCIDGPQRTLVYEYMKNRSLDLIINGHSDQFLDWSTRFQIILGIARGLQYLHEDSHMRIVHRDIKASNILLDDKFHPKIGDFGLARFFPEDDCLSTQIAGTLGYTAPEYATKGELSEKVDIYSFGVLLLEIISCRMNTDFTLPSGMQYLPEYAWKLYEKSMLTDLIDPKLREHGFVEKDVMQAIHVALLCIQSSPNLRPPMSEIVALLTFKIEMVRTPMRPIFLDLRHKVAVADKDKDDDYEN
ncbi:hypothetical protein QN277_026585 [Acacia crassicarpa]|uniref:Protein kinase domain-containing protein n=1 Tax=Acacia crassicarpa TaxID=499986 RepID=A0AAE1K4P1_9FABA|nr:hypothetical protein QN277_026585 [Acacia crassicarpa]